MLQADYAASKKAPAQKRARVWRDHIVKVLMDLLPDVADIRFVAPTRTHPAHVEFEMPYGWVGMQSLSLGYRTLIAWMVDLASHLPLLAERTALLSKARLTAKDEARLEELKAQIGPLPAGETPAEREALEVIQRFAERIRKGAK